MTGSSDKQHGGVAAGGGAEIFHKQRDQALVVRAADLALPPDVCPDVYGLLMDMGFSQGVASLFCLADGTVSLYNSGGGGIIGAGQHRQVFDVAHMMLRFAQGFASHCAPADACPPASDQQVYFYLLTVNGVLQRRCAKDDLLAQRDPMSELYKACHAVLSELRQL